MHDGADATHLDQRRRLPPGGFPAVGRAPRPPRRLPAGQRRSPQRPDLPGRRHPPRRGRAGEPQGADGGMGRGDDRRAGHRALRGAFADLAVGRRRHRQLQRHDRRAARQQCRRRRSFRQARRQRPHLERAGKALPARSAAVRALLRQRGDRAGERSVARPLLSGHVADQRRQSRRRGAVAASRLSHGIPDGGSARALPGARASAVAGADAAGRGRPLRHAGGDAGRRSICRISQTYELGYLAWRRPEFTDYFDKHHIQLPLAKGDAVFFNPALFHAAGSNRTGDMQAHRQPAAGLLRLWPRHGKRRPHAHERGALSRAAGARQRAQRGRNAPTPSPPARKAIPSPPISIATRRSKASRPRRRLSSC